MQRSTPWKLRMLKGVTDTGNWQLFECPPGSGGFYVVRDRIGSALIVDVFLWHIDLQSAPDIQRELRAQHLVPTAMRQYKVPIPSSPTEKTSYSRSEANTYALRHSDDP